VSASVEWRLSLNDARRVCRPRVALARRLRSCDLGSRPTGSTDRACYTSATSASLSSRAGRHTNVIETRHLSKAYNRDLYALQDLSLSVSKGEFVFLTGPSGAGKSTFLRLLLLQERPTEGEILVNGYNLATLSRSDVQEYRRGVGFVFQDFKLIQTRTILENISFVPEVLGMPVSQQRRRAFQVLKWVGLQHRAGAYPNDLSGGEQQRVAIARALVNDPYLILADEPTGNLDPDLSLEIMNLLREVNAGGTTVLVATHDRELIRLVDRRTISLEHGRVAEVS
jgi:cell division transport system ATP-binding protein